MANIFQKLLGGAETVAKDVEAIPGDIVSADKQALSSVAHAVIPSSTTQITPAPNTQAAATAAHAASAKKYGPVPNAPLVNTAQTQTTPQANTPATSTPVVNTGSESSGQSSVPPPGASAAEVASFYAAHPFYFQPGESVAAYTARVTGLGGAAPATTSTGALDTGFMSESDQQSVADSMNDGMSSEDVNSGGSALQSFNDSVTSSNTDGGAMGAAETQLSNIMNDFSTPPPSSLKAYNDLMASSGLNDDQLKLLNLDTIMNGTEDDIRSELTRNGGFATESQISALTSARNVQLQKQASNLTNIMQVTQAAVNEQMTLMGQDQTNAQNALDEKYSLTNTALGIIAKIQAADATTQEKIMTQTTSQLSTMLKYGATLSPTQISYYSSVLGIDPQTLTSVNESASSRYNLTTQLDNANLMVKQMTLSGGGLTLSQSLRLSTNGVTKGAQQIIASGYAQGSSTADITAALEKQYPGQGSTLLASFNDVIGTKNMTGSNIDPTTQAELTADIQTGNYSLSQLEAAYPDVDPAYISSQIAAQ
jgi:hypothetical protein